MKSFQWDKNFETGLDDVDEQHQYLVEIINKYGSLLSENTLSFSDINVALFELSRYAEFHFREEEAMMRDTNIYPAHLEYHIEMHRSFMSEVMGMQAFITEDDPKSAELLLDFLIHWLAYHILGIDQNMARQVKAIESGVSPEEAYKQGEKEVDSSTEPLLNALNGLFEQVSVRNKQLLKLNQSLEDMVEKRTQQLLLANRELEQLSLTDVLTKLPNRRHAMKQLNSYWNESTELELPLVCIMIDADHFKYVNDTYGHDAGDIVLIELSQALKDAFRSDDFVCRLGGDEFFVICPQTNLAGGLHIAELTRLEVEKLNIPVGDGRWKGSISIGVAQRTEQMVTYNDLIKAADESVYLAKQAGKNCVKSNKPTES